MKNSFLALFLVLPLLSISQIVNIEKLRVIQHDSIKLNSSINIGLSLNKNTKSILTTSSAAHIQYKHLKDLYLAIASIDLIKIDTQKFVNTTFLHLRYNRKINKWLRWEAFTQYQNNTVTKIKLRYLIGTGPRFKVLAKDNLHLYIGSLYMYEYDEENTIAKEVILRREHRQSTYLTLNWSPKPYIELLTTAYFQPRYDKLSDYRIAWEVLLKFKFNKHFAFNTIFNGLYDTQPALYIPKINYLMSNRLSWEF